VALTKNGSVFVLYLNGKEVARGDRNPVADDGLLSIGGKRKAAGQIQNRFNGAIDELRYYNRALTAQETAALSGVKPKEFVGAWAFDEPSGTVLLDRSGNQNNGLLVNGPARVPGKFGSGLLFDGIDDYANFPVTIDASRDLTLALWARPDTASIQNGIIVYAGSSNDGFGMVVNDGTCNPGNRLALLFEQLTCNAIGSAPVLPTGVWSHVALVRNGAQWRMYLGGKLSGTTTFQPRPAGAGLKIGAQLFPNRVANRFKGALDDLKLYDRALSEAEIGSLAAASQ
jgi:hypothetical protein